MVIVWSNAFNVLFCVEVLLRTLLDDIIGSLLNWKVIEISDWFIWSYLIEFRKSYQCSLDNWKWRVCITWNQINLGSEKIKDTSIIIIYISLDKKQNNKQTKVIQIKQPINSTFQRIFSFLLIKKVKSSTRIHQTSQ